MTKRTTVSGNGFGESLLGLPADKPAHHDAALVGRLADRLWEESRLGLAPPAWPKTPGYEIVREIGRGGMGVVYLARDLRGNREVALKTLLRMTPQARERFRHEFQEMAEFAHRNLVTLYDLVSDGETFFYTMEYVRGVDFLEHVRPLEFRAFSEERLRKALSQLAQGLMALHAAGKLHRDVKPGNVLVTPNGRVVLLDFGLVLEVERQGEAAGPDEQGAGTKRYMSPEQRQGLRMTASSDWYSVGVMLYEALTGVRPPSDVSPLGALRLAGGLPEYLRELCWDLLQDDPLRRPSGRDVLDVVSHPPVQVFVGRDRTSPSSGTPTPGFARARRWRYSCTGNRGSARATCCSSSCASCRQKPWSSRDAAASTNSCRTKPWMTSWLN